MTTRRVNSASSPTKMSTKPVSRRVAQQMGPPRYVTLPLFGLTVQGEAPPATLPDKTGDSPLSEVPDEPESDPDWKSEAEIASGAQSPAEEQDDVSTHEQNDVASVKAEDDDDEDPMAVEDDTQDIDEVKLAVQEAAALPEDFIEWEAVSVVQSQRLDLTPQVCITLQEWSSFPEQWAKSKDADEKALYRLVVDDIRPQVLEVLEVGALCGASLNAPPGQGTGADQTRGHQQSQEIVPYRHARTGSGGGTQARTC